MDVEIVDPLTAELSLTDKLTHLALDRVKSVNSHSQGLKCP